MLKGENIIYLSNDYSTDTKTSSHQVAAVLAQYNRLLYVESGGMRPPKVDAHDFNRIFKKLSKWMAGERKINDHLFVYTLLLVPFHQYRLVRKFNEWFVLFCLKRVAKRLGFEQAILWFFLPHVGHVVGKLNEKMSIYYCVDEFVEMPGVETSALAKIEDHLLQKADLVFVTSKSMSEKKMRLNANTHYSPHAVSFNHFAKAQALGTAVPADISTFHGPMVGYIGMIDIWFDQELFRRVAERLNRYHFIVVGRVCVDISSLQRLSNVHFLGPRKFDDLPAYLQRFDVCIIPFKVNELTRHLNPIKLKEYLASGKPVVTTPLPDMEEVMDLIEIASDEQDFANKIEKALSENSSDHTKRRIERMRGDTWEARVEAISHVISPPK